MFHTGKQRWALKNLVEDGSYNWHDPASLEALGERVGRNLARYDARTLFRRLRHASWPETFGESPFQATYKTAADLCFGHEPSFARGAAPGSHEAFLRGLRRTAGRNRS